MSLPEDFKKIISYYGVDILSNSGARRYFSDMGITIKYPFTIWDIFVSMLNQHGTEIVSTYNSGDRLALGNLLLEIEDKYLNVSGYDEVFISAVINALAFSLDAQFDASPSDDQADNDAENAYFEEESIKHTNELDSLANTIEQQVEVLANTQVMTEKLITSLHNLKKRIQNLLDTDTSLIQKHAPRIAEIKLHLKELMNKLSNLMEVKLEIQRFYESHSGPPRIDSITTLLRIESNKEFVTYNCLVDDMRRMVDMATKKTHISYKVRFDSTISDSFFYKIARAGLGLYYHYTDSITGNVIDIVFSNKDITNLLAQPMNNAEMLEYLELITKQQNATYPKALDSITTVEKIIIEPYYIVYINRIEPYSSFKRAITNNPKQVIANNIANAADKSFFELVTRLGKGLRYHYYSWPTNYFTGKTPPNPETFDIFFTNDELLTLFPK